MGSSNYITNLNGNISQHTCPERSRRVEYLPFGEMLVEEHKNSNNSPYKFNGKELDEETGNYYYGARYYDPKWSIWLSVDKMAGFAPGMSPYVYVGNNPVNYVDPSGHFRLPAAFIGKYPALAKYLKNSVQKIANNDAIMNALIKHGEFTREQIIKDLQWDKGPLIIAENLTGAFGEFTPGINSSKLKIDEDLLDNLKQATGDERNVYFFLTIMTILHEYTHYGDDQDGVQQLLSNGNKFEEGEAFVKSAYGRDVHNYNHVVDILNSYNSRHGIGKRYNFKIPTMNLSPVIIRSSKNVKNKEKVFRSPRYF